MACAFTPLAPPSRNVEAEGARRVSTLTRQRGIGEDAPDLVERFHVRHRIRARRTTNRRLIDEDDVLQRFVSGNIVEGPHGLAEVLLRRVLAMDALLEGAV